MTTHDFDELWTEYKFRDSNYIAPSPKPMILQPVQIKQWFERGKYNCPVINRLTKRFGIMFNNNYPSQAGRFLQAAYN